MTSSLLIIHPFVQAYRAGLYTAVADRLAEHDVNVSVAQGPPPPSLANRNDTTSAKWAVPTPTRWVRLADKDIALRRIPHSSDLVIVEQAIKNLETYPLLAHKPFGGPSVAMWGHGRSFSTPQGPTFGRLKQYLTRRCDWFFAYTQAGADHVVHHGFPRTRVSVLNNTIDTDALSADLSNVTSSDTESFQRRHNLTPGRTALFLGGVDSAKGIGFLVEASLHAERLLPGFVVLVGGAGNDLAKVRAAQAAGAPVRALGRLDGPEKALALRATDLIAIPSSIGLVAVDSLVSGRPIVTRDNATHGPEADYVRDGLSVWLPGNADPEQYARALVQTLADRSALVTMQAACLEAAPHYSLSNMVDAFVEGVLAWDDVRRAGL